MSLLERCPECGALVHFGKDNKCSNCKKNITSEDRESASIKTIIERIEKRKKGKERFFITIIIISIVLIFGTINYVNKKHETKNHSGNQIQTYEKTLPPVIPGNRFFSDYVTVLELDVKNYLIRFSGKHVDYFDTELREKMFRKSPKYQEILDTLKYIREQFLQTEFYIVIADSIKRQYDVADSCFIFFLENRYYNPSDYKHPKAEYAIPYNDYKIRFRNIPLKKKSNYKIEQLLNDELGQIALEMAYSIEGYYNPEYYYDTYIKVPIKPEKALYIEYHYSNYQLLIYFIIDNCKNDRIFTKSNRVVLRDKTTGDTVYEKLYQ